MVVVSINFSSLCTIAKLIFVSSVLERNEISAIHDSSLLSFVSHASAHARGNRKEKDKNGRKGGKNKNSLATSHAIRRSLSHDQLYQRLRLYANGRRLISIMSINMFFFLLKDGWSCSPRRNRTTSCAQKRNKKVFRYTIPRYDGVISWAAVKFNWCSRECEFSPIISVNRSRHLVHKNRFN